MPRLRPVPEFKEEPKVPVRQLIPHEDEISPPESQVEAKPNKAVEPEVVVEDKDTGEDANLALKKQIEDLKKSEEIQRNLIAQAHREREEALRRADENEKRLRKLNKESFENQELALDRALDAAKAEAEKALLDYKNATSNSDVDAQAEAMDRLTEAKANMKVLERGRDELKEQRRESKKERKRAERELEATPRPNTADPIDGFNLPPRETEWLKAHRQYVTDPKKAADLRWVHEQTMLGGLKPGDDGYLEEIEKGIAMVEKMRNPTKDTEEIDDEPVVEKKETQQRSSIMSAPVSREGGGGRPSSTRIHLTKDEKEAAAMAGISEVEYARNKQRLAQMRADGTYGER